MVWPTARKPPGERPPVWQRAAPEPARPRRPRGRAAMNWAARIRSLVLERPSTARHRSRGRDRTSALPQNGMPVARLGCSSRTHRWSELRLSKARAYGQHRIHSWQDASHARVGAFTVRSANATVGWSPHANFSSSAVGSRNSRRAEIADQVMQMLMESRLRLWIAVGRWTRRSGVTGARSPTMSVFPHAQGDRLSGDAVQRLVVKYQRIAPCQDGRTVVVIQDSLHGTASASKCSGNGQSPIGGSRHHRGPTHRVVSPIVEAAQRAGISR